MRRFGGCLLLLGMSMVACDESTAPDPNLENGAGIRFVFPADADSVTDVVVQLWGRAHNNIPVPDCAGLSSPAEFLVPLTNFEDEPDLCTRMSLRIRNWIEEDVRTVTDIPYTGSLAWGWDQKDDAGNQVPGGIYKLVAWCLDSQGSFYFSGDYYVQGGAGPEPCQWLLWSQPLARAVTVGFGPFNPRGETWAYYETLLHEVGFLNPFVIRVYAPGMSFEQEITLTEGKYTDIHVTFHAGPPSAPVGAALSTRELR